MPTLVYSPGIRITIATARHGIIDVSDDISSGNVALQTGKDGGHQVSFRLVNKSRKYDGVFTPNDRIVVHLKRIRWLQVFSGYLNSVPMYSVYATGVNLSASDTLKRVRFSLYDPGAPETVTFFNSFNSNDDKSSVDSDLGSKITGVISEFANWDKTKIHIGGIPVDWYQSIGGLYRNLKDDFDVPGHLSGSTGGKALADYGSRRVTLPAGSVGGTSYQEGPGFGYLPSYTAAATTFEPNHDFTLKAPSSPYYVAMRWPYTAQHPTGETSTLTVEQRRAAERWWRGRHLLIVNPALQRAVVAEVVSYGPPPDDTTHQLQLSVEAGMDLGLSENQYVDIRFAGDDLPLGRFTPPAGTDVSATDSSHDKTTQAGTAEQPVRIEAGLFGAAIPTTSGPTTNITDAGIVFQSEENARPNVVAARAFIEKAWPGKTKGRPFFSATPNSRPGDSDHPRGLAMDVMMSKGEPSDEEIAYGNQIAYWFVQNPGAFGCKYVIWNNMIYRTAGAKVYANKSYNMADPTGGHRDHVHISFEDTGQTSVGQMGSGWPVTPADFMNTAALGGVVHQSRASSIGTPGTIPVSGPSALVSASAWYQQGYNPLSVGLAGPRVLLNDIPVKGLVDQMFDAAMRDYCSAPNGDIIAWWPDYFNLYGVLSRMVVQTIELEKFTIQWSDQSLITHQFVTGSITGYGSSLADGEYAKRQLMTHGIATVEYPEILETLLNANRDDPASAGWLSAEAILQRFGARVNHAQALWATSPEAEFWMAVHLFRQSWASMFSCDVPLSFMPELFPGMILQIPEYGIQLYVARVEHSIQFGEGGGFSTTAKCIAPSTIGTQSGLYGLPRGGAWIGSETRGPAFGINLNPIDATTGRETDGQGLDRTGSGDRLG